MGLAFRGLRISPGNGMTQAIADLPDFKMHLIRPTTVADCFAQHRQHMRTNIKNHAVRMTQLARIRLTGGKIERHGLALVVKSAGLLQKSVNTGDILD